MGAHKSLEDGKKLNVIELFAGAGGLAQGFLRTNKFNIVALSDINENAQLTFRENYSSIGKSYICKDIADLQVNELLDCADGRRISGVIGGPPCQGFSLAGLKKKDDQRNHYIRDYARFVHAIDPDFLLMENVPQIIFNEGLHELVSELEKNFEVRYAILNSAQYGVAQTRHRAFILAFHRRLGIAPAFPAPTHSFVRQLVFNYRAKCLEDSSCETADKDAILGTDSCLTYAHIKSKPEYRGFVEAQPLVTVGQVINDLIGEKDNSIPNHVPRQHKEKLRKLISSIPEGGGLSDIDPNFHPKSHYSQAYGRLHRQGLARTITTWFQNAGSGRFIHPVLPRTLTVREAARLQSFSDDFVFHGFLEEQMRLVGNAVPPRLAEALAQRIALDIMGVL